MNCAELSAYLGIKESYIKEHYSKMKNAQLKKGYLIEKNGRGINTIYTVTKIKENLEDPKIKERKPTEKMIFNYTDEEIWKTCSVCEEYEISNHGKVRNKNTQIINKGTVKKGYIEVSIKNKKYLVHRLVLMTFNPVENMENLTIDHINGIRQDNHIDNLRWCSSEENIFLMMANRKELNKELTRIINIFGYEETLKILQNIGGPNSGI